MGDLNINCPWTVCLTNKFTEAVTFLSVFLTATTFLQLPLGPLSARPHFPAASAGAAQRRNRDGLLIQGSVQAKSTGIDREAWEIAMLAESEWSEWQPDGAFIDESTCLAKRKYASDVHNQNR